MKLPFPIHPIPTDGDPSRLLREQNRRAWDAVVPAHCSHHRDLAGFLRAGQRTTFPEEEALLGDLAGTTLLHLLCNTGQDTLSLASLGARATGVDISAAAIAFASELGAASGIPAQFVCADIYDYLGAAEEPGAFARIFCSYGAICWLPDLHRFANGVARLLAPAGRFVLVEFHPISNMFDADWQFMRPYPAAGRQLPLDGIGDYVGDAAGGLTPDGFVEGVCNFTNPEPCHLFQWGVGEVVTALAQAGLVIEALHEYPFCNGERPFNRMRTLAHRRLAPPTDVPELPLLYAVAAVKSAERRT